MGMFIAVDGEPNPKPPEVTFTEEEEKEFTPLNCLAFQHAVKEGMKVDRAEPMWLCMSVEARAEFRQAIIRELNRNLGTNLDEASASERVTSLGISFEDPIRQWKLFELQMKQAREEGNPRAFFVPV